MSSTLNTPVPTPPTTVTEIATARRRPGRPKAVRPAPDADEYDYLDAVARERDRAIENDDLHRLHEAGRPDTLAVLWAAVEGVAREAAGLRWNREHAEASGADAQKIASRRVEALGRIASLLLEGKKLGLAEPDHRSSVVEKVEQHWMQIIADVAAETLPAETAGVFLRRLRAGMVGWRDRLTQKQALTSSRQE